MKYSTQPDSEKVILAVARDPAAIGFVDMSQLSPNDKSVKLVPVVEGSGVGVQGSGNPKSKAPSPKTETPNPSSRTLTLYVSPKASQTAKDFADFLTPEHCKETIAQYNLLPPLHAEEAKLASRPHPSPLPKKRERGPGFLLFGQPLSDMRPSFTNLKAMNRELEAKSPRGGRWWTFPAVRVVLILAGNGDDRGRRPVLGILAARAASGSLGAALSR